MAADDCQTRISRDVPIQPDCNADRTVSDVLFLDASNIRSSIGASNSAFNAAVQRWASESPVPGRLIVIARDHGGPASQVRPIDLNTFVSQSGPRWKADDTIVRDVGWWLEHSEADMQVVTTDKHLRKRCRERTRTVGATHRLRLETSEGFASLLPKVWLAQALAETLPPEEMLEQAMPQAREWLAWVAVRPQPPNTTKNFALEGHRTIKGRKR